MNIFVTALKYKISMATVKTYSQNSAFKNF